MAKNVLIAITRDQKAYKRRLEALNLPELEILAPETPEEIRKELGRANIMLAVPWLAKEYINEAKNARWVQSVFAGIDALNAPELRKDYVLTNIRDVYGVPVAEYVFAYILAFKKELFAHREHQLRSEWKQRPTTTLEGETICILGAGSIGKEIARIAKAFGMRTIGYRKEKKPVEHFDEIYAGEELAACLAKGDYVVDILPNTRDTDDLVNEKTISHMKKTALFINVGRGNSVNEEHVAKAAKEKRIAGAVLDVFRTEPLPSDNPLWKTENVYVTPHVAGYILGERELEIFAENYRRFCAGGELMYRVDFEKGY